MTINGTCTCVRRVCQHGPDGSCDVCIRTLRPYQAEHVRFSCSTPGNAMVVSPTGSGKTIEIVACVPLLLTSSASHVVIVTPQEHVEVAFTNRAYRYVRFPSAPGMSQRLFEVGPGLIQAARSIGGRQSVEDYLRQPGSMPHALCTTHAAWRGVKLPDVDLSGHVLFVDEAHRAPAKHFAAQSEQWSKRGGLVRYFTATDYRGDGVTVLMPGMARLHRGLALHMDEGWAPHHFRSSLMPIGSAGDSVTADQFYGNDGPQRPEELASAMVAQWLSEQRPKVVVRVPPMRGGSQDTVQLVIRRFTEAGARVIDASGIGDSQATQLIEALRADNDRCHACSEVDVIVGVQRVSESLDWVRCAAVYSYGIPGSPTLYNQLAGRSLRKKADDHPHKEDAWINFFVDTAGGAVLDSMSKSHSRETLLMCCYTVDTDVGFRWSFLKAARQGVLQGSTDEAPVSPSTVDTGTLISNPKALAMLEVAERVAHDPATPLKTIAHMLTTSMTHAEGQLTLLELLCVDPKSGPRVQARVAESVAMATRRGKPPLSGLGWLFEEVLEEFMEATLDQNPALQQLGAQMHKLTGQNMFEFTYALRRRTDAYDIPADPAVEAEPPYDFDDMCRLWDEVLPELTDEGVFSSDGAFIGTDKLKSEEIKFTFIRDPGYEVLTVVFVETDWLEKLKLTGSGRLCVQRSKGECRVAWNIGVVAKTKRDVIATLLRQQQADYGSNRVGQPYTHKVDRIVRQALKSAPDEREGYIDYHHRSSPALPGGDWREVMQVMAAAGFDKYGEDRCARSIRETMLLLKWVFYQSVRGPYRLVVIERDNKVRFMGEAESDARFHELSILAKQTTGGPTMSQHWTEALEPTPVNTRRVPGVQ